jgi:hypothetical protein
MSVSSLRACLDALISSNINDTHLLMLPSWAYYSGEVALQEGVSISLNLKPLSSRMSFSLKVFLLQTGVVGFKVKLATSEVRHCRRD